MVLFKTALSTSWAFLFLVIIFMPIMQVRAGTSLPNRFDKMSNSAANETSLHQVGFDITDTTQPVGSISIQFCSNTPIVGDSCIFPAGIDVSGVSIDSQTGTTGFSVHPNTTNNRVVMTRPPSLPVNGANVYVLGNILNPANRGTLFVRVETFSSTDATGPNIQEGGIAIYINSKITVGAEVPPFLTFCVAVSLSAFDCSSAANYFIDLGSLRSTITSHATSQFIAGTNAEFGYSVTISGTTLTSGLNTINALNTPTIPITGVNQFGFNLRQNTTPNNGTDPIGPGTAQPTANYSSPNLFKFTTGDIIASVDHSDDMRKFTVNYITNVSSNQPGGVYATTLLFICLANF
jgi:hypothetical protein